LQVDAVTRKADEQKREADLKLTEFAQLLDIRAQRIKVILLFYPVVCIFKHSVKTIGKVFPYSLPSVGPGADPGVQAVSPQVT